MNLKTKIGFYTLSKKIDYRIRIWFLKRRFFRGMMYLIIDQLRIDENKKSDRFAR